MPFGVGVLKMKKVFSALTVIVALFLVSCMSEIKELSSTNQKGNVALFIGNSSPKTISPAAGLSWRDVSEWTAEFTETNGKYDTIYFYSLDFSKGSYVLKLPVGNFSVKLYGFTSGTTPVKYSGTASVSISEESTESVSLPIFVSTEKTVEGKGSFQFTLGISTDSKESISIVSAILESKSASLQDVTLAVTQNQKTGKYTLTAADIPSGFYDLSVKCTVGSTTETVGSTTEKEIFKNYSDSVVEIIDGMTTSGSKDITVVTGNTKSYYCTLGESKGNGLWKAYPANIDEVLTIAKDATVKEVNINMTDGIPAIDLAKIGNKVYYIYDKTENLVYTIDGTTEIAGTEPDIALGSIDSLTLKDSSGSNLKADISGDIETIIYLTLEDNTSIRLTKETTVVFANTEYNSYYAENPFCTASSQDWSVSICDALANNYMVTKKTVSETEYNYYVVPSVNSSVSVQSIPTWSIKVEPVMETGADNSYTVFTGDSVTYKASFDEEFTPDSFTWYVNGEQYSTTGAEISVTLSDLDTKYNPGEKNTILCVVSKNGEYSSKAVEITALPETYVLYEKSSYYNVGYTYSNSNPIEYTSIVNSVADFCTDEIGNIYTLSSDGTVTKYEKSSTGFYENIICSISTALTDIATDFSYEYIEVSNGYVFVSGYSPSESSGSNIYSCIKVSLDSGEVTVTNLGDFTGSVSTFSPYNGGEYIYSIESDSSGATLNKYSTSTGTLTSSVTSILYSTDSAPTDETVLKDYVTSANCYYFSLKDMYSTNGYIYLTASETGASLGSYDVLMNAVSRGGVIKFSTEDLSVQADASAIIYGWDTANVTGTSQTDVTNAHTSPNTTFYGAEKIIAVKPDEIVIADDGFEFTGTGAGNLKQKNRVVTFSLKQMAITSVVDDVAHEFDTYFSGSAFNN